jgi:hypothetical protein
MTAAKSYFQDRLVLLLLGVNAFLAFFIAASVLFRLQGAASNEFIVQYRASLGVGAFKTGNSSSLYSFMVFALLVFGIHFILSLRTYHIKQQLAVTILGLGSLLLLLGVIVGNALLVLR